MCGPSDACEETTAPAEDPSSLRAMASEARQLLTYWPQTVAKLTNFFPRLVSLGMVGHLPENTARYVAAAGIGIMYCNISGVMLLRSTAFGSSSLYSQAFGAGNHRRAGHVLLRVTALHCLVMLCFTLPLTALAESLLLSVGQPRHTAKEAGTFFLHIWCDVEGNGERHRLPGSPYNLHVTAAPPSATGSNIWGVEKTVYVAGEKLELMPQLRDAFGNATSATDESRSFTNSSAAERIMKELFAQHGIAGVTKAPAKSALRMSETGPLTAE